MASSRPQSRHSDLTDDDDHFSDATEGRSGAPSGHTSPVPHLRVSKDEPKSLKGHAARKLSTSLPGSFDDEDTIEDEEQDAGRPPTRDAAERTIPATVVTPVQDLPELTQTVESFDDATPQSRRTSIAHSRRSSRADTQRAASPASVRRLSAAIDDDGFGDFDDFGEGTEGDDFGDFGDEFEMEDEPPPVPEPALHYKPILRFDNLDTRDSVVTAVEAYLAEHFPLEQDQTYVEPLSKDSSVFLSERSRSLWSQLVAPPPLQPPNWLRSRIRRLFLVSLGVPVDLDEILPASKQKKLVLPSTFTRSPSSEALHHSALDRLKDENNSQTSVASTDSKGIKKSRRKKEALLPTLDVSSAKLLCATTDTALQGLDDQELRSHVQELERLKERAAEVLQYWEKKNEGAKGDKEAFEGVIENLVKHARKVRK